ncbi:TerD family protein [Streptomyces smyrnaeus]|uniref:TerD family protein n=1 Tax=Streptomyces smyrnaeus TaxID=1387713 RepID=A0ABS3XP30_9ACTN|nr:TerD family protein [Streptomyces smyrnaeus]MBO8197165.1 TerD family protein [Streptomyces smyrnaeus]
MSSSLNKGLGKVEVTLKWDPSAMGEPPHDLDIVAATYTADAPHGEPAYLVHFDSRSPDGTITLNRDSKTGQGFGSDEVMTLELERLAEKYTRVVVGVAIQQGEGHKTFDQVPNTAVRICEGYEELSANDFSGVPRATAATVAEFVRGETGEWHHKVLLRGYEGAPEEFASRMGIPQQRTD